MSKVQVDDHGSYAVISTNGRVDFYLGAGSGLCQDPLDGTNIILRNLTHEVIRGLPCLHNGKKHVQIWLPLGGETFLRAYLSPPYFWGNLDQRIGYHEMGIGLSYEVAGWMVTPKMMQSGGWNYGFRFDRDDFAFAALPEGCPDPQFTENCNFVLEWKES